MSLLSVNSIDVLAPLDGHILVVGDIWLDHRQITSTSQALSFFQSGQNGALTLAITLQAAASACTLVSYVGDDSVGREITQTLSQCGVTADLLAIKNKDSSSSISSCLKTVKAPISFSFFEKLTSIVSLVLYRDRLSELFIAQQSL